MRIVRAAKPNFAELDPNDCAAADGLMIMRWAVTAADLDRFPRLRCVVRMGVGYDKLDRKALAGRDILVCNVPDYGTTEVADHAMALVLTRRCAAASCCTMNCNAATRRRHGSRFTTR